MPRVVIALSGGVDSAVAAALLLEQGHEVVGVMMRLWGAGDPPSENRCCSSEAVDDARRVAGILGIPFYLVNYEREFREHVVEYFLDEYSRGRTPNPCIACNRHIKFGLLMKHALALDCEYLATGHYARVRSADASLHLLRGVDRKKDQSYMLHMLGQEQLSRLLLPLGELSKDQVRSLAAERGLPVAEKAESQDLCFVPSGDYRPFLRAARPDAALPGPILTAGGDTLGKHHGLAFYTVGQRHGLGSGVARPAGGGGSPEPAYVTHIDQERNAVIVGASDELWGRQLTVSEPTFVSGRASERGMHASAKVRYRSPEAACLIEPVANGQFRVTFSAPQRAITPGQAIVFYDGEEVLGGGVISVAGPAVPANSEPG